MQLMMLGLARTGGGAGGDRGSGSGGEGEGEGTHEARLLVVFHTHREPEETRHSDERQSSRTTPHGQAWHLVSSVHSVSRTCTCVYTVRCIRRY